MYQKINKIKKTNKLTIEQLYNLGKNDMGSTMSGHESVDCACDVLNIRKNGDCYESYYAKPVRVIRHKVTKDKWHIVDYYNNEVFVTDNHSIMVFRNGGLIKVLPHEIDMFKDKLVSVYDGDVYITDICTCKKVGRYENEYVYDIEMKDESHTFVANDILVHNSVYSQLDEVISTTDWCLGDEKNWRITIEYTDGSKMVRNFCGKRTEEEIREVFCLDNEKVKTYHLDKIPGEPKDFAIALDDAFLSDYFKKIFDEYAARLNADNYLNFELETYSDSGIWLAKKKYMQNIRWTDSMPRHDILDQYSKIKSKGVELIQPSSPTYAREKLTYLVRWIFSHTDYSEKEFMKNFAEELRIIRDAFYVADVNLISWNKKATEYNKWIVDDNKELVMRKGTPITTKGIAFYNYLLNNNPKEKTRFSNITPGTKCKYCYCIDPKCEMIAYEPGPYPPFAPEVDRKQMFEKTILAPINRVIAAIGYQEMKSDLVVLKTLRLF